MSELGLQNSAPSQRKEIRAEAANWFARANSGDWDTADQEQLDAWLAESRSHRAAYWRLEGAWTEAARLAALRLPSRPQHTAADQHVTPALVKISMIAAVAAVIGVAGYTYISKPATESYATAIGGHRILNLSDGSRIELNTNTIVRTALEADQRQVWLDKGEAYFQIKHDPTRQFVVIAGGGRITDLGTKFLVRQNADQLEVDLFEGRARLEGGSGSKSKSIELSPGEVASVSAGSTVVTRKSSKTLESELGWRRGVLVFEGTSLADAAAEMNRYNVEQLVVADPSIARRAIDGTFPIHAVPQFTEMAQAIFGLRVEKQGDRTLISR